MAKIKFCSRILILKVKCAIFKLLNAYMSTALFVTYTLWYDLHPLIIGINALQHKMHKQTREIQIFYVTKFSTTWTI